MKRAIGGYFGLEPGGESGMNPHSHRNAVNTGRNAFRCILESLEPEKVMVPVLSCDAVLEPLKDLSIPYEFYSVSRFFRPVPEAIPGNAYLLYINYFGVCDHLVSEMSSTFPGRLIVDNTQAFFSRQIQGIPSFWSARKFFGVPDGGYFCGVDYNTADLPLDSSENRMEHLLKRRDVSPEAGYPDFLKNERLIGEVPLCRMSPQTTEILDTVDFPEAAERRQKNYEYLHSNLKITNKLGDFLPESAQPISYPYLTPKSRDARRILRENRIYVPVFWPEVMERAPEESFEETISDSVLHLPVDQRYDRNDMDIILGILSELS